MKLTLEHLNKEQSDKLVAFLQTKIGEIIVEKIPGVRGEDGSIVSGSLDASYILLDVRGRSERDFVSTFKPKHSPVIEDYNAATFKLILLNEDGSIREERTLCLYFNWVYYLDKDDEGNASYVSLMEVLEDDKES